MTGLVAGTVNGTSQRRYSAKRKRVVHNVHAGLGAINSLVSKAGPLSSVNTSPRDRVLTNQSLESVQGIY